MIPFIAPNPQFDYLGCQKCASSKCVDVGMFIIGKIAKDFVRR